MSKATKSTSSLTSTCSLSSTSTTPAWGGFLQCKKLTEQTFSGKLLDKVLCCFAGNGSGFGIWKHQGFYYIEGLHFKERGKTTTSSWVQGVPERGEVVFHLDDVDRVEKSARGKILLVFLKSKRDPETERFLPGEVVELRSHSEREIIALKKVLKKYASLPVKQFTSEINVMKVKEGLPEPVRRVQVEREPI